jgi:hypothetical protein
MMLLIAAQMGARGPSLYRQATMVSQSLDPSHSNTPATEHDSRHGLELWRRQAAHRLIAALFWYSGSLSVEMIVSSEWNASKEYGLAVWCWRYGHQLPKEHAE